MWKRQIVSGVLLQSSTITDGQIKTKAGPPLALRCVLYEYAVGTHLGNSLFVVHEQQPRSTSTPPPLPRVTAACSCCKIVQPSELNYRPHWAETAMHVPLHAACMGMRKGVSGYLLQLLLKDLYSYLWCSGISLSPFLVIIHSRQGMKWHFLSCIHVKEVWGLRMCDLSAHKEIADIEEIQEIPSYLLLWFWIHKIQSDNTGNPISVLVILALSDGF